MGENRLCRWLLGLCMADSGVGISLGGLCMAPEPRYAGYEPWNCNACTRGIRIWVPCISHLVFRGPRNLPSISELSTQGRPDSAHPSPKSGRPRPFPSDSGMNFAFASPKSDGISLFLSDSGVRMRARLSFGPSPSPVPVPAAVPVSSPSPSLSPRLPAVGWR